MAQYLLLIFQDEDRAPDRTSPGWESAAQAHRRFREQVAQGPSRIVSAAALEPTSMSTTLRADTITDGPFAETKEVLGGFYVLDAEDLDEAIRVAALCPAPLGGVEVRPLVNLG